MAVARSAAAAIKRTVLRTRAWAAPQVDNAGKFLQRSAAPKVSAMLSSAARRIEPAKTRAPRQPAKLALGGAATLAAAASAVAAAARGHRKNGTASDTTAPDTAASDSQETSTAS